MKGKVRTAGYGWDRGQFNASQVGIGKEKS